MKAIIVCVLLLSNCLLGFTQIEWAPIGAKWHISKIEGTMPPDQGYILYEVTGNSILQGKNVKVINKTYFHSNGKDVTPLENEYTYEEDSVVYYWKNGRFYTLYDFSARPGDRWTVYGSGSYKAYCDYDSLGVVVVDSVSTLTINNHKLKAIYTSPEINSDWHFGGVILERIGNITHILPKSDGCILDTPDDEGTLRCYEDKIIGIYKAGYCKLVDCKCDELISFTGLNSNNNGSFQVYPNPVKDYLDLHITNNNLPERVKTTEIYNLKGEKLASYTNSNRIFVGSLRHGLYFLKLSYSDQQLFYKFIKE
jgi:hypothetical protein